MGTEPIILVGVSGGRDSVALLHMLHVAGKPVQVCHVHHQIRGATADRDADFVREFCSRLGVPCYVVYKDVPAYVAEHGVGIEEAARLLRYEAFQEVAEAHGITLLALAQHLNDQAETSLFQFIRGSAFAHGMLASVLRGRLHILRPLLEMSRQELTDYCLAHELLWCEDESNMEVFSVRNRLRHEALPLLNDIMQRDVAPIIARSAKLNKDAKIALSQAIQLLELIDPQGRLYLPKWGGLPKELQKASLFYYLQQAGVPQISEDLVDRVFAIMPVEAASRCSLPGGMTAHRKERRFFITPAQGEESLLD